MIRLGPSSVSALSLPQGGFHLGYNSDFMEVAGQRVRVGTWYLLWAMWIPNKRVKGAEATKPGGIPMQT